MSSTESNPIRDAIAEAIGEHEVILFMKGTPEAPACGFSARTVAALQAVSAPFAAVDVLPDPRIREELSALSNWPTIPQLFVKGELVGGCDIVMEMYETGELSQVLDISEEAAPASEPLQAQPSQAQPSETQRSQAQRSQAQPSEAQPLQAQPLQAQPSQAQPLQAPPQPVAAQGLSIENLLS